MAIVKMKKLRVIAPRKERDALLRELQLLGCVELTEQNDVLTDENAAQLVSRESGDVQSARSERKLYGDALAVLDAYAPQKTPLLRPKTTLSASAIMAEADRSELLATAKDLVRLDGMMHDLDADLLREQNQIEALTPWLGCELPLDCAGTKHVALQYGTLPANADMDAVCAALSAAAEESELFEVSADASAHYVYVMYLRESEEAVSQALRSVGFAAPGFAGAAGTAADGIARLKEREAQIREEQDEARDMIVAAAEQRDALRTACDRAGAKVECAEAVGSLLRTENTVLLEGWAVADEAAELTAMLDSRGCAWELTDPSEEEYPEVPVKLRNNRLTDGLNMVTDMYSLPAYGSVDPNPLMAPFFILFYGIMMADMGYGLVMMILGALILWKKRPQEGFMRYFGELMVEGGVTTFIMGILTGGFFGDALKYIVRFFNPASTWEGLPALINPLQDTVTVLIGALILGFIHLLTGMVISFVMKLRRGQVLDALCGEVSMWVLFVGAGLTVLGVGGKVPLIIGLVAYVLGKVIPAKGVGGRILAIFIGLYNDATGWFGDVLSYSRLMALMLAGSVIAQVFNNLGAMPGNIIVFLVISIVGNALNFGLNLLGCYVHDLRLQCLEFFGKFYEAGGRAFRPLAVRSRYFDLTK